MNGTKETKKGVSKIVRAFLISVVVLLVCSMLNWGVVTSWGKVDITRLTLVGDDGLEYSALMYVPENATNETPAPAIAMYHGNSGNGRNHESWAVEFARRGFVVISVDNLGSGDAEYSEQYGRNVVPDLFTNYLLELPIVDATRFVTSGHSLGGDAVVEMTMKYQPAVCMMSNGGAASMLNHEDTYYGNILVLNGTADKLNVIGPYRETTQQIFVRTGTMEEGQEIVPGQVYGSFEEGNANMLVEIEDQIHEAAFIDPDHIAALIDFTQQAIEVPNPIDANDQVWMWKDVLGLLGMFALAASMILLALCFIERVPFFASIKQPLPRNIGMRGKDLGISITCALVFPLISLYTGAFGLINLLGSQKTNYDLFHLRFTNIAMGTLVALNVFGAIMFLLFHKVWGKKKFNATLRDYGLTSEGSTKLDFKLMGKCLLLAIFVVAIGWSYLAIQEGLLGTDFYCLFFGYKPIALFKLQYFIPYMIVWALCFAVAAVGMNVERRLPSTGNETKDTIIAVVFNVVLAAGTITAMVFIETAIQISLGSEGKSLATWGTDITRLWGMPVGMIIGAGGNTFLYRKTGNIWLGAIMMGFIAALGACLYGQIQF